MDTINGTIVGTLSEERIREICRQNFLDSESEDLVIEIIREWDKEINDAEQDAAFAKEKIKGKRDEKEILSAILDIVEEFFLMKRRC